MNTKCPSMFWLTGDAVSRPAIVSAIQNEIESAPELWLALHSAMPLDGKQCSHEADFAGYGRLRLAKDNIRGGVLDQEVIWKLPDNAMIHRPISHVSLGTEARGSGLVLLWWALRQAVHLPGDTLHQRVYAAGLLRFRTTSF